MRGPEPLHGWRVVADPPALDALEARTGAGVALRIAPDDLLVLSTRPQPALDDPRRHRRSRARFRRLGAGPAGRPGAAGPPRRVGAAGRRARPWPRVWSAAVPAKLWLREDGSALLLCLAALRRRAGGAAGVNEFVETLARPPLGAPEPKRSYDVVIIGGGGHGLSTAYHLATRHGITNVAVLERDYIGSGNSGRNTTIIRANYGLPEAVRFYQHSLELYQQLEDETGCDVMHATKGQLWLAHSVTAARTEQARALLNTACGAHTTYVEPEEIGRICPQIDLHGGGRYPVLGASYHVDGATARHDRVVWAYAQGAMRRGVHVLQGTEVTGLSVERRPGHGRGDGDRAHRRRHRAERGRRPRHPGGRLGRRAAAHPHPHAAGLRHQRLRPRVRAHRQLQRAIPTS